MSAFITPTALEEFARYLRARTAAPEPLRTICGMSAPFPSGWERGQSHTSNARNGRNSCSSRATVQSQSTPCWPA